MKFTWDTNILILCDCFDSYIHIAFPLLSIPQSCNFTSSKSLTSTQPLTTTQFLSLSKQSEVEVEVLTTMKIHLPYCFEPLNGAVMPQNFHFGECQHMA